MNSKLGRFIYLLTSFVLGAFFLMGGIYSFILPWFKFLQTQTIHLILHHTLIFSLFGLGLMLIGASILILAILNSRRRYVDIRTGQKAISIDENLIQHYLEKYWKEQFPNETISSFLTIKKNALYITTDLPALNLEEQRVILNRVQEDFEKLFSELLGYPHEIYFTASFKPNKSNNLSNERT